MRRFFFKLYRFIFPPHEPTQVKRKYHLPESLNLNIQLSDGWFVVTSPDYPGLITQARSQKELIEMVNDAVLTYFDVPMREAEIIYDQLKFGDQTIRYTGRLVTKPA